MKHTILFVALLWSMLAHAQLANPDVTADNLQATICNAQYVVNGRKPTTFSQAVRPPTSYTNPIKIGLFGNRSAATIKAHTKILGREPIMSDYELDHWIPISDGGHPKDPRNLKLQLWQGPSGASQKDIVEAEVHRRLCKGTLDYTYSLTCWKGNAWKSCLIGK